MMKNRMCESDEIERLAALPYNNLLFALDENDPRWEELVPYLKDLCPDFEGWLMENKLERTPENALEYISVQYEKKYAERDRREMDQSFRLVHEASCKASFHALLGKRFRDYIDSPYKGELKIGHFVGVIGQPSLGVITNVHKDLSGNTIGFDLSDEKGSRFYVNYDITYRIY